MVRRIILIGVFTLPFLLVVLAPRSAPHVVSSDVELSLSPVDASGEGDDAEWYESAIVEAPFTMSGVRWRGENPEELWYRTRTNAHWSEWTDMHLDLDHGPDPGTAEAARGQLASEPVFTGPADAVQYRFVGAKPAEAVVTVIDTTSRTQSVVDRVVRFFNPSEAAAAPPFPNIHPRSDWDPTNRCVPRSPAEEVQVTIIFIHHTTIEVNYSASQVPSIILGYCLYHRDSKGWNDVAYNFFVDRFGAIWEGRAGGIDRGVRGAHTKGFSTYSSGIALIGNYLTKAPGWSQRQALQELLAWKLAVHNLDPRGTSTVVSKGSYKWDQGEIVTLSTISGHRDAQATACPGNGCYNLLPTFRAETAKLWSPLPADTYVAVEVGDFTGDGVEDGATYRPGDGTWWVTDGTSGNSSIWRDGPASEGWSSVAATDLDGDGRDEIVGAVGGDVRILDASGASFSQSSVGSVASGSRAFPGDFDGDGRGEVVFVTPTGGLEVVDGGVAPWGSLGANISAILVEDFDGDGVSDLAGFTPTGAVVVARSTGSGFTVSTWADVAPNSGWSMPRAGDYNGDGRADVVVLHSPTETWHLFRSTGSSFRSALRLAAPTEDRWSAAFTFDHDEDGIDELIALDAYTGSWFMARFEMLTPYLTQLDDTPYRTTVNRPVQGGGGDSFLVWYGQEFRWLEVSFSYSGSDDVDVTERIAGSSRYDTMADVAASSFSSADVVFVATGEKFPDALTAGAAAVRHDGPVLLTKGKTLSAPTRAEVVALAPARIVVTGGPGAVSDAVLQELAGYAGEVVRIGGTDRYETAAQISAAHWPDGADAVLVATGQNYPDALAGVAAAKAMDAPILLVGGNEVPVATAEELARLGPDEIIVLGGPNAVSESVLGALRAFAPQVSRLSGPNRYATATAISVAAYPDGARTVYLAAGTGFADAVAAGPAAAHLDGPLLLVQPDAAPGSTIAELLRLRPDRIIVLGGTAAISDDVLDDLKGIGMGTATEDLGAVPRP